jgi:hypothetical protein
MSSQIDPSMSKRRFEQEMYDRGTIPQSLQMQAAACEVAGVEKAFRQASDAGRGA